MANAGFIAGLLLRPGTLRRHVDILAAVPSPGAGHQLGEGRDVSLDLDDEL